MKTVFHLVHFPLKTLYLNQTPEYERKMQEHRKYIASKYNFYK